MTHAISLTGLAFAVAATTCFSSASIAQTSSGQGLKDGSLNTGAFVSLSAGYAELMTGRLGKFSRPRRGQPGVC